MELLPLHIEYLLTRRDCVIVPGVGAFIATERESEFDTSTGALTARRRDISFNSSVVSDDGLLTHSIARRERISYEEAHCLVVAEAGKIQADLQREGETTIGLVGRLVRDEEGCVAFEPRISQHSTLINVGLSLQRIKSNQYASQPPSSEKSELSGAITDQKAEKSHQDKRLEDHGDRLVRVSSDRYFFTVSKRALHVAATFIALLTIGLSLMIPINHDQQQKASVISFDDFLRREQRTAGNAASKDEAEADTIALKEMRPQAPGIINESYK